jgi:hypothetical protein
MTNGRQILIKPGFPSNTFPPLKQFYVINILKGFTIISFILQSSACEHTTVDPGTNENAGNGMHTERCTVTLIKNIHMTTTSAMLITISVKYCQRLY